MEPGRDRISKLPIEILDHILRFLPLNDAAKTVVLSSIWRDVWFNLTQINFDDRFFSYLGKKHSKDSGKHVMKSATGLFLYVIDKVLCQHNGTIQKFVLNFYDVGIHTIKSRSYDFDQWLRLVTGKGVEEMHIRLGRKIYRLPNCIFSCSTLKRLHLSNVIVEPMKSPYILPNVALLSLEYVNFDPTPHCAFDIPVLESLLFYNCKNIFNFNIAAPKLCDLTIKCCYSDCLDKFLPVNLDLRSVSTLDFEQHSYIQGTCLFAALVHLLQSCPKLCRLDINIFSLGEIATRYGGLSELLSKLHGVAQTNKMLRVLKFIGFSGLLSETLFIKELLICFSALEKVYIIVDKVYYKEDYIEQLKFGIMQIFPGFPRASTKVEFVVI